MKENKRQDIVRHRKKRREREKKTKIFVIGAGIAIVLLSIYLVWALFSLIMESASFNAMSEYETDTYEQNIETCDYGTDVSESGTSKRRKQELQEEFYEYFSDSTIVISETVMEEVIEFAMENNISISEYPQELLELLQKNPETKEFVLNYPLQKGEVSSEPLTPLLRESEEEPVDIADMPLLMQWDERWGYYQYGDNVMGLTGCGPTSLSMVASYLLNDPELTPLYMADYSIRNGYCVEGFGSSWELMAEGAKDFGLGVSEVSLSENVVKEHLESGNPIICIMGEGDFTDNGHFIVFKGWKDGKIIINDSNSRENSEKLWAFNDIQNQIKNMWAYWVE